MMIFPGTGRRNVRLPRYTRARSASAHTSSNTIRVELSRYLLICRTIIKFVSHPRQIPYEGCIVRAKRIGLQCMRKQKCGQGVGNFVGFTSRGVGVLRRTGPPHGGAHAGKIAAALWASCGDAVTNCCADPLAAGPAMSRQTILNWREPTDVRRSSLALSASDIVVVVDHESWPLPRSLNVHHLARQASGGTHAQSHGGKNDRY
jgi:hypothetical protein